MIGLSQASSFLIIASPSLHPLLSLRQLNFLSVLNLKHTSSQPSNLLLISTLTAMEDSSNAHVGTRRLSKPRTNRSSSNLLSEQATTPLSPQRSPDQDYFGRDAVVINSNGERRSRSKSRGKIRAYLYGSSHDAVPTSSDDEEAQNGIAGAARDARKKLSRTGSAITPLQSAKASVKRLSNSSSSGLLSIRSTESQAVDSQESAMIVEQIKQKAYHDSLAAQNHVSSPVDEDRHVDSVMAPLRRKSLYTPGIATRNASDILQKPPKPSTDHDYYYDPSRPETSPLSDLAALKVGEDGRSTPCNLHYSQLGGLQLGTLRVTNGASSPVPGDRSQCRSATPESKTHDEYYTASEGSVTGDRDQATPLPPRGGSPLKYESKAKASMRTDNEDPSSPDKALPFERESSDESFPFSREIAGQAAHFKMDATDQSARFRGETPSDILHFEGEIFNDSFPFNMPSSNPWPLEATKPNSIVPIDIEAHNKRFSPEKESHNGIEQFERKTLDESLPSKTIPSKACSVEGRTPDECFCTGRNPPKGASDIADEYIAELDGSSFSYPSLQNKNIALPSQPPPEGIWRSFINESEVQHADDGGGSREEAFRKLTVNANLPSTWQPDRLSVPLAQPSRCSASSDRSQTDSGYCSHVSMTGAPAYEVGFEPECTSVPATKVSASPPPQAVETVRSSARSSFRLPTRKLQKQRPKSQPPPIDLISVKQCHELNGVHIPRVPSIMAAKHADRVRQFTFLEQTLESSHPTTADRSLSLSKPHHELIRFPSPTNAPDVASIPLRVLPTDSSEHRASKTIVEEDARRASDLVRSPSWSEFGGGRRRKEQKKLAKEEKQLGKRLQKEKKEDDKQKSARSRSASRTRASSQHNPPVTIADFGTVTESLGNSPYDIATAMSKPPIASSIASNWHPHQMSTAMPRPKSMFGMDDAAASDFARTRSRKRSQSFGKPSVGQAARMNTNCRSHDPQPTRDASTEDKASGTPSAILGLSTVKKTSMPTPDTTTSSVPGMTERISGERHRSCGGGNRPLSLFTDAPSVPALAAVDFKAHDIDWARNRQRSQTFSAQRAEAFDDRGDVPAESMRFHSGDTPPVPALPSVQQVKQREAELIRSRPHSMVVEVPVPTPTSHENDHQIAASHLPEPGTSAAPRKTKGSRIVPDLWSNGSLERKSPKTVERSRQASHHRTRESDGDLSAKDNLWESQSYAWSQRRKSAGEALLRNQVRDVVDSQEAANPAPLYEHSNRPPSLARAFTSGTREGFTPSPSHLGPFPNAMALHHQLTVQQPTYISRKPIIHNQSTTQQTQLPGCGPRASPPRPSVSSIQHGNPTPTSNQCRAQTQSFRIPRKRIGSGPSILRTETTVGSGRHEGVLV